MQSDPTTAAELHALVSQWPVEAQPKAVEFEDDAGELICCNKYGACFYLPHAIDLHVASGIKWLVVYAHNQSAVIATSYLGYWVATDKDGPVHSAPTLLLALHAAIMATAKEGA